MKLLLLLLLLTSWSHLGSEARICKTGETLSSHLVSIEGSRAAGTEAYFIKAYPNDDLNSCLEDCCAAKFGSCSVAAYKNKSAEATCLHFYCEPLSKCKFFSTNLADSYVFPHWTESTGETVLNKLVTPVSTIVSLLKDHERSVTARKGVENILLTRKGVSNSPILHGVFDVKDSNTSVPPQERVGFDVVTTPLSSISVIKPRKGVETQDHFYVQNSNSKINARKGVEPFLHTLSFVTPSSSTSSMTLEQTQTSKHNTIQSAKDELLSILENVFVDDTNFTESTTEVPKVLDTHLPTLETITPSTTTYSSFAFSSRDSISVIHSSPVHPSSTSSIVAHTSYSYDSHIDIVNSFSHENSLSSPSLSPSISYDQTTVHFSSIPESSTPGMLSTHNGFVSSTLNSFVSSTLNSFVSSTQNNFVSSTLNSFVSSTQNNFVSSTQSKFQSSLPTPTTDQASFNSSSDPVVAIVTVIQHAPSQKDIEESDRRYKSSMHLVFALVFGLLVLFGVFGAVAKRVYDVWIRRHYHRMDFLIDGMYDGYS